jgi:Zn-dependent protease with chaperone function
MTGAQHTPDPGGDSRDHSGDDPGDHPGDHRRDAPPDDPVRRRRHQVARWTLLANRIGYLVLATAIALFVMAFVFGFNATMAGLVIACMIVSFALLAPSIVLGYAVKAAERDDVERGV